MDVLVLTKLFKLILTEILEHKILEWKAFYKQDAVRFCYFSTTISSLLAIWEVQSNVNFGLLL